MRLEVKKVFDLLDPLFIDRKYEEACNILDNVDLTLHPKILVAYLSISNQLKHLEELKYSRTSLLNKIEKVLQGKVGIVRSENILKGLR